jgi:hypothetical protein
VVSIVPTKRRRFFWAAWWSAPPESDPFRRPDASNGGARSREEARVAAEQLAKQPLEEVEARWARAWMRVLRGEPPWTAAGRAPRRPQPPPPAGSRPWALATLGLPAGATNGEIRRAFKELALRTHPDRGGDDAAFIAAKRAYDVAMAAVLEPRRRRRKR